MRTISYPFRVGKHGRIADTVDTRKIWTDRVRAVLNTEIGDRVMRPSFGVDSTSAIMSIGTPAEVDLVEKVQEAFAAHLPSLSVTSVTTGRGEDGQTLTVEVVFTCPDRSVEITSASFTSGLVTSELDTYEVS